jgi:hypothetical protein
MDYSIISQNGKETLISVIISGKSYNTLIICNDGELDSMVQLFVNSVTNPPKPITP